MRSEHATGARLPMNRHMSVATTLLAPGRVIVSILALPLMGISPARKRLEMGKKQS
jgi:hypothetical protein